MDVILRVLWQVVVHYVGDTFNVDSSPGNIRGDHDFRAPRFEVLERFGAFSLSDFTGQHAALDTFLTQLLVEPPHLIAPVGKNNDALDGGVFEQIHKHGETLPAGNQIHLLIYRCRRHPLGLNLNGDGLKGPLPGKIHDVLSKGGRE